MDTAGEPPADRFCDLVMKGGITSGIVYPKAIASLAARYRFKSIGGTSAGAIAAAITAAAEYQRRHTNTRRGFELLSRLPEELLQEAPGTGRSQLLGLFQPQPGTRRLFSTLVFALNRKGTYHRIAAVLAGLMLAYWPATLSSMGLAAAVFPLGGALAAAFFLPIALTLSIGAWVYVDITRRLPKNGFGMCSGLEADGKTEALTPWLHERIQRAARLRSGAPPLTFGQLWEAPGFPAWLPESRPRRSIDLQMFATNLGHGRPYIFPQPANGDAENSRFRTRERLFFRPQELAGYLPEEVLAHMTKFGKPYRLEEARAMKDPEETEAQELGLLELPSAENLPIVFAARMSLSFPLLLSAVPLWAINYDSPRTRRHFERCWFSDGGISSNFPVHLFDGLLPLWPTFGISLEPAMAGRGEIFLPQKYTEGYGERWNQFDQEPSPASRMGGFLSAIVQSMQNWNDNALARMPGFRDRIARVRLEEGEGGMNLDMPPDTIEKISTRGADAAKALLWRFDGTLPGNGAATGWDEQRFVRLGVLLKMIEARKVRVGLALDPRSPYATPFSTLIDQATRKCCANGPSPPGYEKPLSPAQAQAIRDAIAALERFASDQPETPIDFKPVPAPELRVRPPL